jgi:uncharacterized protein YdcH (DUF465 family)
MDNHDLHHEFPQFEERIHELKISDNHFRKLFDEYHQINKDIHRVESSNIYTDAELNEMRLKRIHLKDELFKMINN